MASVCCARLLKTISAYPMSPISAADRIPHAGKDIRPLTTGQTNRERLS
uniref:Rab31 protein n=1 Tax=Mus musculus TaxID=10090 RepID=Q99K75_MOUSE|nr:Rab31 protein [Mus musculus]